MRLAFHLMDQYRAKHGLSKRDFADLLGWHSTRLPQYLSGTRKVSIDTAAWVEMRTRGAIPMHSWLVEIEPHQVEAAATQIHTLSQSVKAFWDEYVMTA